MSLIPTSKKTSSVPVTACMNVVAASSAAPAPKTPLRETFALKAPASTVFLPQASEQIEQKTAQAVMPSGAVMVVSTSGKGVAGVVSIVLANGRSILVNSGNVRITGMPGGGFSVITPKATVIYDSGGNELSVIPGATPPADAAQGSVIFSTATPDDADPAPSISSTAAAFEPDSPAPAQETKILSSKKITFPASLFALP
ncbi:hypothetical protein [Desulfovibrio intestinalis]|uniref:Glucose/arabinose dehydrogenase n=1 Tax=Desulfovibrio intestinalis TaxID=58621 RepID=A0A7W8FH85_9BACT|nr:hypothetical protein [Desulfovibrio intestinalis]MBB5144590.1 glucose/arabinose dehydrogenase [Desulfovibrio intestinalis]